MNVETMSLTEAVSDWFTVQALRIRLRRTIKHNKVRILDASLLRNGEQVMVDGNQYTFMGVLQEEGETGEGVVWMYGSDGDSVWYHDLRSFELTATKNRQ